MTNYLISTTGLQVPIYTLPGREPFMLAADLAEAYGTDTKRIGEQVKRNPDRFPEDFAFILTEAEMDLLRSQTVTSSRGKWSHFATTSQGKRADLRPLVFTHGGAAALSGVLKTPVAANVSVVVFRTFAAFEKRAVDELRYRLLKAQMEVKASSKLHLRIIEGVAAGLSFEAIWRAGSASRPKLTEAVRDLYARGLIDGLPAGTPAPEVDLFGLVRSGVMERAVSQVFGLPTGAELARIDAEEAAEKANRHG